MVISTSHFFFFLILSFFLSFFCQVVCIEANENKSQTSQCRQWRHITTSSTSLYTILSLTCLILSLIYLIYLKMHPCNLLAKIFTGIISRVPFSTRINYHLFMELFYFFLFPTNFHELTVFFISLSIISTNKGILQQCVHYLQQSCQTISYSLQSILSLTYIYALHLPLHLLNIDCVLFFYSMNA